MRKKSLTYSVWEGSFSSGSVGIGESFFSAFAIFLNATSMQLGLLGSVPQLLGSLTQLLTTKLIMLFGSRKRLIITGVALQALTLIPIMLSFTAGSLSIPWLLLFTSLYFVFGMVINPAWSSWMGDLVDQEERGSYFGMRNRITGITMFLMLLAGGLILQHFKESQLALTGFLIIFSVAMASRLAAIIFFIKQEEPEYKHASARQRFSEFARKASGTNYGLLVIFLASMNFAVAVASPYFAAYMLKDLSLSYWTFTIITGSLMISKYLFMPLWGRVTDKYGAQRVMTATGLLIPLVPILWLFGDSVMYIIIIQVISGFVWAGFEIASFNFLLDATAPDERVALLSYYNVINGVSVFVGSIIGALLVRYSTWHPYFTVFLLSGALRLIVVLAFAFRLKEVRTVQHISYKDLFFDVLSIEPDMGVHHHVSVIRKELLNPLERETKRMMKPIVKPLRPIVRPIHRVREEVLPTKVVRDAAEFPKEFVEKTMKQVQPADVVKHADVLEQEIVKRHKRDVRRIKKGIKKIRRALPRGSRA